MSGQLVNYHKSSFECAKNVPPSDCLEFKRILRMDHSYLSLGKYLGSPIITERITKETFGEVVDKAQKQLSKRKASSLSQMGHSVHIKANLSVKANFQIQSFLLPSSNTSSLDRINRNFLWNEEQDSASPNLIGWDKLYKPKCYGGLGIRKANVNNVALQFKVIW